jgi:hypothetical protein
MEVTTPSCKWVADRAMDILRVEPNIGNKELCISVQLDMTLFVGVNVELLKRFMGNGQIALSYCLGVRPM